MKQQHRWHTDDETEKLEVFGVKEKDGITLTGVKRAVTQKCTAYIVFIEVRLLPRERRRMKRKRQIKQPRKERGIIM